MDIYKDKRTRSERELEDTMMNEIVQSAVGVMNKDTETQFIEDALSKVHVVSRDNLRFRLIAVAGSDDLIRKCVSDSGSVLLFRTQDCSDARIRQIIRSLRDGVYIYKRTTSFICTFSERSVRLGKKLSNMIREEYGASSLERRECDRREYGLNISELREELSDNERDNVVSYVLSEIYPDDV